MHSKVLFISPFMVNQLLITTGKLYNVLIASTGMKATDEGYMGARGSTSPATRQCVQMGYIRSNIMQMTAVLGSSNQGSSPA